MADLSNIVGTLYKDKVTVSHLQSLLLDATLAAETGRPTPSIDQKSYELIFNYLQANKAAVNIDVLNSFSVMPAWICVGKEVGKFLALVPNASLEDLMTWATANNFDLQVTP